jgi:predicted methyltransferase
MRATSFVRGSAALLALLAAAALPAPSPAQSLDPATGASLDAALAGPHRSDRNRARDRYRHPKETLAFFGLRRNMTVVEVWPGGGWYTEILAPVLRDSGKLFVAQYGAASPLGYQREEMRTLAAKAQSLPAVFDKLTFTALWQPGELDVAPTGTVDLALTFRNVHNWLDPRYQQDATTLFKALFRSLKPGGVLGVVDHRWPDAATEDPAAANGYVSEQRVIALARAAGFEFEARSDINRNPLDTHAHPAGVWSLPPDLQGVAEAERSRYLAIGESDRLTLRFRKPL